MAAPNPNNQTQWLVRKNVGGSKVDKDPEIGCGRLSGIMVLGPYLTDQILTMVEQGMLEADDELCPESGYWFYLYEGVEVRRFLGIDYKAHRTPDEEATQPDLAEEVTPPGLVMPAQVGPKQLEPAQSELKQLDPESTGVIRFPAQAPKTTETSAKAGAAAQAAPKANPAGPRASPTPAAAAKPVSAPVSAQELANRFTRVSAPVQVRGIGRILGIEKNRFWGVILVLGLALAFLGVAWVVHSLAA